MTNLELFRSMNKAMNNSIENTDEIIDFKEDFMKRNRKAMNEEASQEDIETLETLVSELVIVELNAKNEDNIHAIELAIKASKDELAQRFLNLVLEHDLYVSKSPYLSSFYAYADETDKIDWGYKPEESYRLADHWNWNDGTECPTIENIDYGYAIAQFSNGKYHRI